MARFPNRARQIYSLQKTVLESKMQGSVFSLGAAEFSLSLPKQEDPAHAKIALTALASVPVVQKPHL